MNIRGLLFLLLVFSRYNYSLGQNYVFAQLSGTPMNTTGWTMQGGAHVGNIMGVADSEMVICAIDRPRIDKPDGTPGSSGAVFYNQPINLSRCHTWIELRSHVVGALWASYNFLYLIPFTIPFAATHQQPKTNMQTEQTPEDESIFEEFYERSSAGKRLANYLIDIVLFYIVLFVLGFILALVSPTFIGFVTTDRSDFGLLDRLITLLLYAVYMSVVESLFHGKSLGKLITKTKAVNLDGTQISTAKAFERGFSRAVPFCVFSAFGNPCDPWQDRWTNTMVINEKK